MRSGIGNIRRVEPRLQGPRVDRSGIESADRGEAREPPCRIDDLLPAAIVEGDDEGEARIVFGQLFGFDQQAPRCRTAGPPRRPITRTRTSLACNSARSLRMNRFSSPISIETSSAGRFQFSVEKL